MAGAAQFRTEYVQQAPRGWRTRTIVPGPSSRHEVRIAFPPGRRRKGSGRVVEILHPADERNPRCEISEKAKANPGELLIFGNPNRRGISGAAGGQRPGHQPDCACFACRAARGEKTNRSRANGSRLAQQRAARERAASIRAARLNPSGFWKHFTKGEKQFLSQRLHVPAPKSMEDVQAYKEALRKIDEINAKYKRGELSRDSVVDRQKSAVRSIGARLNPSGRTYEVSGKSFTSRAKAEKYAAKIEKTSGIRVPVYETTGARRNPAEIDQAVKLFQSFHGHDPKEVAEKHVSAAVRLDYTALGDLEYLIVKTPLGKIAKFFFDSDGVKLAAAPPPPGETKSQQLYAIGGNQNLLPCLDKDSQEKDFIDLGEGVEVQYVARKVHGGYRPVSYFHHFGEINGSLPRMMFDKLRKQIFFIGGDYFIDTSKGVSPGIEN